MLTTRLPLKALSLNSLYATINGRRVKTKQHRQYMNDMVRLLPSRELPSGKLFIAIEVGLSNPAQDLDNCLKPILDAIQAKYQINDKEVYSIFCQKKIVRKGQEYIAIMIKKHQGEQQ